MANSIQNNSSTVTLKVNAEMSEIKRVSQENEKLFCALVESLNNLSDKLIMLDLQIKKKLIETGFDCKNTED